MLSVCIITKNEEKNIERCLRSLLESNWELVVVDTGSIDKTRDIARRYTNSLYDFTWCDDFSAAKNYAISKAKYDLVMVVDSDEFMNSLEGIHNYRKLEEMACQNLDTVGRICRRNIFMRDGVQQENKEWLNRIFDRRKFRYEGRIHEQVVPIQGGTYETWHSPLTFLHTGYDLSQEEKKRKCQRNIKLLEQELSQIYEEIERLDTGKEESAICEIECAPDAEHVVSRNAEDRKEQIPYLLYQLGKSHYMAGDYPQACVWFDKGLSYDLNPKLEYVIDMVETYGYALINSGQEQEAIFFENIYEEFGNTADFQFLMGLIYMKNARFEEAVGEFQKALCHADCRSAGANSYAANYNIGVIQECLGNVEIAKKYYQKCGAYQPAQSRLAQLP